MSSLTPKISFDVKFLLGGTPAIQLSLVTTLTSTEQENFKGYFSIRQPDGITETGDYDSPDMEWDGSAIPDFTKVLRLGSDQQYQRGNYVITLYADHPNYTPGTVIRNFEFTYKPVTQVLTESFDVYTPVLRYLDETVYTKGGYTLLAATNSWTATTTAGSITPGTSATFDLAISGSYYDATYNIVYVKTANYEVEDATWLTIDQTFNFAVTAKAYIPQSTTTLLTYLNTLKDRKDARPCSDALNALYEKAAVLYQHIRNKICARDTASLKTYFDEFYRLTHNYQSIVYSNTGSVIPAYDFTTGCGGSGSGGGYRLYSDSYTASADGESALPFNLPAGARVITAVKGILPLKVSEYDYSSPNLNLLGGISLGTNETVFITYELPA